MLTDAGKTDSVKLVPVPSSPRVSFRLTVAQLLRLDPHRRIDPGDGGHGVLVERGHAAEDDEALRPAGGHVTVDEIHRIVI